MQFCYLNNLLQKKGISTTNGSTDFRRPTGSHADPSKSRINFLMLTGFPSSFSRDTRPGAQVD